jgi:hypothetical protein
VYGVGIFLTWDRTGIAHTHTQEALGRTDGDIIIGEWGRFFFNFFLKEEGGVGEGGFGVVF